MINKITLTQKQMQVAIEHWLNTIALKTPVSVTQVEKITDGVAGTKFEISMIEPESKDAL